MLFRSIGQRGSRRRRILSDGQWAITANTGRRSYRSLGWTRPLRKSENYGDAEFLDQLPRAIELVPTHLHVLFPLFLLALGAVVGLEALYFWMPGNIMAVEGRVEAFDLASKGNLAGWISSMSLVLGGMASLVVFSVRRYRTDDYLGHYRVWLWAALCCFLISMDQTANLRAGFSQMAIRVTGTPLFGDGSAWWLLAYGFLFGAVGTRLLIDVIDNYLSAAALLGAFGCYALCGLCQFGLLTLKGEVLQTMVASGSQLLGNLLILFAITFHVRYVLMDAEGLLRRRRRRSNRLLRSRAAVTEMVNLVSQSHPVEAISPPIVGPSIVVRPPQGTVRPVTSVLATPSTVVAAPVTTPTVATSEASQSIAEAEVSLKRKLTKAERKAMRDRLERIREERQKRAG